MEQETWKPVKTRNAGTETWAAASAMMAAGLWGVAAVWLQPAVVLAASGLLMVAGLGAAILASRS